MKHIISSLMLTMCVITLAIAAPGPLFTVTAAGNTMTVTPTASHYYPDMGIKLSSGHTVGSCTPHSNGFCRFAASNTNPKVLTLTGPLGNLSGIICLNGPGKYSCQKFTLTSFCNTSGGACRVFVTSTLHDGDLGGITGGNAICQNLATAAGLGGTWKAWLSTSSVTARANIQYDDNIRYVRAATGEEIAPKGVLVLDNDGATPLSNSIGLDENGISHLSSSWTGTNTNGTAFGTNCMDWGDNTGGSGHFGDPNFTDNFWTLTGGLGACSSPGFRFYCFEVPS
jgi:Protein of unknown function (DUF1554)